MRQTRIIIAAVLALSPFAANADLIEVTGTTSSDGIWDVSLVEGTWDGLLSDLMDQEWWSDATGSLAQVFAEATGDLFGFPNGGLGPFFAFDPSLYELPDTFAACYSASACDLWQGVGEHTFAWATARKVSEPGTLGLLVLGLFVVGLTRRKKSEA